MSDTNHTQHPREQFASTQWSIVLAAGGSTEEAQRAIEELCEIYWYPLYAFARRQGHRPDVAEDLTQGLFVRVLEKQYFSSADPSRGRFRSFLITIFKRFIRDEYKKSMADKRGGKLAHLSIDVPSAERRYQAEPVEDWTPERLYERRWAMTLLDRVLAQLRESFVRKGKESFFMHAQVYLTSDVAGPHYAQVAEQLNMSQGALRVAVHRLRAEYRRLLCAEVSRTLAEPNDVESELEALKAALSRKS